MFFLPFLLQLQIYILVRMGEMYSHLIIAFYKNENRHNRAKLVKLSISKVNMNVRFNCLFLKKSKVKAKQHFFISKHRKTPKTITLLVYSSPSNANDLGSGKIRILIWIIRIHGFTNYSDLFRIGSEPDSIPKGYSKSSSKIIFLSVAFVHP